MDHHTTQVLGRVLNQGARRGDRRGCADQRRRNDVGRNAATRTVDQDLTGEVAPRQRRGGRRRSRSVAFPRQICMYLARDLTGHSLEEIGGYFGGRDHTTVLHAYRNIDNLCDNDEKVRKMVNGLVASLPLRLSAFSAQSRSPRSTAAGMRINDGFILLSKCSSSTNWLDSYR